MWKEQKSFTGLALGESDYTKMAYELAVRMPEKYEEIRATQATRIQDPDRKREFNFIVRAVAPETETRGHNSPEAAQVVRQFLEQHPDYPVLLKNKILQSADHLYR